MREHDGDEEESQMESTGAELASEDKSIPSGYSSEHVVILQEETDEKERSDFQPHF